jgi:clan AA aspartic protease (TIGR02281 family)
MATNPFEPAANSEFCRAMASLIADGSITSLSHAPDVEELRKCGLSYSRRGEPLYWDAYTPAAITPPSAGTATESAAEEIQLERLGGGVFAVSVVINGAITIPFVLDSGAEDVQVPAEVVLTLMRTGTLSEEDFLGASTYVLANGATLRSPRFNIREMQVDGHVVRNVAASVGPAIHSDALLGQSFLSRLPSWTLDNQRHVLVLGR